MKTSILFTTIILTIILSSCASAPNNYRYKKFDNYILDNQLPSLSKIRTFKMLNWSSLDYRHLILSSHHNKKYLITLDSYCHELEYANSIGLKQSMDYTLSTKFDSVILINHQNQECRIKTIHEINKQQAKELLELRRSKKEDK